MNLSKKIDFLGRNFWLSWLFILLLIFFIHCLTLTISPILWQDEAQIIEYGRTFLEPNSDWSYNWNVIKERPVLIISYLGCLLQELAFRASGFSVIGPRLLSIVGGLFASSMLVGWLLSRATPHKVSAILGIAFLLDPWITQSYRGDRVDCWAIGLCFLVCWLLQLSSLLNNQKKYLFVAFAGAFTSTAFFVWPSVLIIYPLIFYEILIASGGLLKQGKEFKINRELVKVATVFSIAGLIATVFFLVPILPSLSRIFEDLRNHLQGQINIKDNYSFAGLYRILSYIRVNPFLPLLALIGLFRSPNKPLLVLTCAIAFFIALGSNFYVYRAIYLSPYIILLASLAFYGANMGERFIFIVNCLLVITLIWSSSISLAIRPFIASSNSDVREVSIPFGIGENVVGRGNRSVLDNTWHFYPTGRSLGWKIYNSFYGVYASGSDRFLSSIEFVITNSPSVEFTELITNKGFQLLSEKISLKSPPDKLNESDFWTSTISKILLLFNYTSTGGYKDYSIYRR